MVYPEFAEVIDHEVYLKSGPGLHMGNSNDYLEASGVLGDCRWGHYLGVQYPFAWPRPGRVSLLPSGDSEVRP